MCVMGENGQGTSKKGQEKEARKQKRQENTHSFFVSYICAVQLQTALSQIFPIRLELHTAHDTIRTEEQLVQFAR